MDKKQLIESANRWVDEQKPVETINENETVIALTTAALGILAGSAFVVTAFDNLQDKDDSSFWGKIRAEARSIQKSLRYKSLNKAAIKLINNDEEVQTAFKAYTNAAKGQKLKSLKSFMDLIGTKLDTKHSGLLQKVIGDLKAEYNKKAK